MRYFFGALLLVIFFTFSAATSRAAAAAAAEPRKPNIVVILTDDLGYGDVGCYGATKIKTPNVDRIAREGCRFIDGHSSSSTCTPSRYAIMTGEYPWRHKGTHILPGDAALIIAPGRPTLPAILKSAGYTTAAVGKWHLGLGTVEKPADWNGEIKPGPLDVGFDHCFIMAATADRVPCVYINDRRVVGLDPNDPITVNYEHKIGTDPTGAEHPEMLKMKLSHGHADTSVNGISRIGWMSGGRSARWVDEDMADTFTREAVKFIEDSASQHKPFFLYFATHDPHVPHVPNKRFAGTSGCGVRGDAIQQMDWCVGQVLATLDKLKLTGDTLLIFTSVNGPVVDDGYADGSRQNLNGHKPAGIYRGGKYTPYEGGTRIPWIVRWPGKVKPGSTSDALICQTDLLRSLASLAGQAVPTDAGPDSQNVLPALLGESPDGRKELIEQGRRLAIRSGNWKLIEKAKPNGAGELYDLSTDPGEKKNLAAARPEIVKELETKLAAARNATARDRL
jgi:arylsulfatase A-like enzyme